MTFKEKLAVEQPDMINPDAVAGCVGCPKDYEYEKERYCSSSTNTSCTECWNREMPKTTFKGETKMKRTKKELLEEIAELKKEVERVDQRKQFDDAASTLRTQYDSLIDVGFSEADAMTILITMIQAAGGNR